MPARSLTATVFASAALTLSLWTASPATAAPDRFDGSDAELLVALDTANRMEVTSGKVALEKSGNKALKDLADRMVVDHTKAGIEIKKLAVSRNFKFPADAGAKQDSAWPELQGVGTEGFDRRFVRAAIAHHEATEQLLKRTQMSAQDVELRELAAGMLPAAERHLQAARRLTP